MIFLLLCCQSFNVLLPIKIYILFVLFRKDKTKGIAEELLSSIPGEMEANARKLTMLCRDELQYSATTGKIHLQATSQGSQLLAIVSTMATMLTGETQLVESMNSIIRLIGNRCPSIDLATMSARLTIKKALSYSIDTSLASSKRWSTFVKQAGPLLQDMMTAGQEYLVVHTLTDRFTSPLPTSWIDLNESLSNTDLRLALPDLKVSEDMAWASSYSGRIRSLTKGTSSASKEKKQVILGAGLKVFVISAQGTEKKVILPQAFTYRSQIVGVLLEKNAQGQLVFKDNALEFVSVADALKSFFSGEEGRKRDVLCKVWFAQAVTCPGGFFRCLQDNGHVFEDDSIVSLLRTQPLLDVNAARFRSQTLSDLSSGGKPLKQLSNATETKKSSPSISGQGDAELTKQCLEDVGNLAAGYAFQDEMNEAQKEASNLDEELDTKDMPDSNRARIQKVVKTEAGKKCQDVTILEQAVDIVRETHSKSDVCLTRSELEEEALLLLIQEFEKQQTTSSPDEKPRKRLPGLDVSIKRDEALAGSSGGSQCRLSVDAEIQEILKSSSESNTKQDQKLKYQCFQDNDVLVQVLMDESESRSVESDTQTDAIFSSSMLSRDRSFYSEKPEKKSASNTEISVRSLAGKRCQNIGQFCRTETAFWRSFGLQQ